MNDFKIDYNEESKTIIVHKLEIQKEEVVQYLLSKEKDTWEEVLNEILEFGVKSLKSFLTENYGNLIDSHFKNGFSELDSKILQSGNLLDKSVLQVFIKNANETIVKGFTKEFDDKKDALVKLMDEKKDKLSNDVLQKFLDELKDKVFSSFKTDFKQISDDLKDSLTKYVTERDITEKTTLKGGLFEDYIVERAELIAKTFGDYIDHIGADNQTGDVLVENSSDNLRFCIEVKDTHLTDPKIKETFEEMEKVRKVQHSMIVFRNSTEVSKSVGAFHLFGRNRLVLALAGEQDDDPNTFLFNVGYRLMRFLTLSEKPSMKGIDTGDIIKHINNIEITLKKVTSLKAKVTSFSTDLTSDLDELKRDIDGELKKIEGVMEE